MYLSAAEIHLVWLAPVMLAVNATLAVVATLGHLEILELDGQVAAAAQRAATQEVGLDRALHAQLESMLVHGPLLAAIAQQVGYPGWRLYAYDYRHC